jgi:hypothetical protein
MRRAGCAGVYSTCCDSPTGAQATPVLLLLLPCSFATIHGKCRFPGLFVWLADGRRVPVRIPQGCLLLQAGRQMEWLTGGHVQAGMHEVGGGCCTRCGHSIASCAGGGHGNIRPWGRCGWACPHGQHCLRCR